MKRKRYLIVNADDFGMSPGVNRGIMQAHETGIVTSTSLMVRWPAARDAASLARVHPALSVGLHLDLGEWVPRGDDWIALYAVVPADDRDAVRQELDRQLATFRSLTGHDPTHLDSHQHVHRKEPVYTLAEELAATLQVPLRQSHPAIHYCGGFYGQSLDSSSLPELVSFDHLVRIIRSLPAGVSELCTHPGFDDGLATPYREERALEVRTLCDPRLRDVLSSEQVELCSFTSAPLAFSGEG